MPDIPQPQKITIDGWHFRVKYPPNPNAHSRLMLLLHGYQGNENVMWILTNPLPDDYLLLAPRAPQKIGDGQFIWHEITPQWPNLDTYHRLSEQLLNRVDQWCSEQNIKTNQLDLMGFSQGAVMAYAMAMLYPDRIGRVAALAGFIPHIWHEEIDGQILKNKAFFIAHGTQDAIIPIKKARQAAIWLEKNGAQVTFCEAEIGHKLSSNCFNGLGEFFN